jgi:hypothetical protein
MMRCVLRATLATVILLAIGLLANEAHATPLLEGQSVTFGFTFLAPLGTNKQADSLQVDFNFGFGAGFDAGETLAVEFLDNIASAPSDTVTLVGPLGSTTAVSNGFSSIWTDGDGAIRLIATGGDIDFTILGIRSIDPDQNQAFADLDNLVEEDVTSDVPEPGTLAILGTGLLGLMAVRRRRLPLCPRLQPPTPGMRLELVGGRKRI